MQAKGSSKSFPIWLALALIVMVIGSIAFEFTKDMSASVDAPAASGSGEVLWMEYQTALEEAKTTGKPIFYDFSAEWCGPCRRLDYEVFHDPKWAGKINKNFIPVQVIDRRREEGANPPWIQELQNRYAVTGFPTLVIDSQDGSQPAMTVGYGGPVHFESFLNSKIKASR